jgi:hypothetical protein
MMGGPRQSAGRKLVKIDLVELEKLCSLQCTDEELAAWFSVSVKTIANRRKQPRFSEVMERGKAKGRISVRRAQMKLLEAGNATMGVWLGKQLLGQRDVVTAEHTGLAGDSIQIAYKPDLTQLTDEELRHLREIAFKATPDRRDRPGVGTQKLA